MGATSTLSMAGGGELWHQVGKVGLHPFARFVPRTLPAERPLIVGKPGRAGHERGRFAQLVHVARLLLRDTMRDRVGGEQDVTC